MQYSGADIDFHRLPEDAQNFRGISMQFLFIEKNTKKIQNLAIYVYLINVLYRF